MTACDVRNHHSSTVAAEAILEETGELRVSIRDIVLFILHIVLVESINAVTESEQRPINVGSLDHSLSPVVGLRTTL